MPSFYKVMLGKGSTHAALGLQQGFIGVDYEIAQDLTGQLPDQWQEFNKKFIPSQATFDISVGGTSKWGCQKSYTWDVDVNANFNWGGFGWKN